MQIHDEFNTLADSFGLYKSTGGSGSSYDRSLFNSIYNGDAEITRTTIKTSVTASQPRLSIISAGHHHKIIEMLQKEKKGSRSSDGFISRFVFCAPQTLRISLKSVKNIPPNFMDVRHILIAIFIINKNFNENESTSFLTYTDEAFILLSDTFETYDRISAKYQLSNPFIR